MRGVMFHHQLYTVVSKVTAVFLFALPAHAAYAIGITANTSSTETT